MRSIVPRMRSTSLASSQYSSPIDSFPLLLEGMATSTFWSGESLSQKAITGTFTYDASFTA